MADATKAPGLSESDGAPDVAEYLRALRVYMWLVILLAVASTAVAVAITARQPRIYEASCVIEYDPNPPRPLGDHIEDVAEPVSDFWSSREFFETQNHIISSRLIAERVVERLGLQHDRTFPDDPGALSADWEGMEVAEAAEVLQGRITVQAVEGTRLVSLRVRDRNPERAALIANTIADTFIEKTIEDRMGSTVSSLEWLGQQLDTLRGQLDDSERALHAFKQEHNILSVSMEDRQNLVASELEHFSEALDAARTQRIELRAGLARLRALREADTDAAGVGFEDAPAIANLQSDLRTQLAEREALSSRYGEEHPRMHELDERIASLRSQVRTEEDGLVRSAEADVREAQEIENGLQHAIDEANTAGLQLNLLEIEYTQLNRQRENNEKLYGVVLERTTQTDLTRMLRTTHVRMVDRALTPDAPVSPRVMANVGVGVGVGILLGVLAAVLLGRLDRRIKGGRDVEQQGLTLLGALPVIDVADQNAYARGRRRQPKANKELRPDIIAHTHPMSSVAENCRTIRTNLMFAGETPLRTLAVTSANPQEGKTTVTANLAISLAQSGKRVLVIDTDMRRPRVHRAFAVSGKRGITSIIVGEATLEQVVQDSGIPNVSVLACGPIPPNPAELLHRERFHKLLEEVREKYDLVVFDSPPLTAVADAAVLAPQVDGTLVVVRSDKTTREAIRSVLRQLRDVGGRVIGGVLNGLDSRGMRADGGDYYYYYGQSKYYSSNTDDHEPPQPPPATPTADGAAE